MKLLRTIRLDPSDQFVFERVADPGEWAVSGAFAFGSGDPARLEGKVRTAFRSGFLGVASLGWSTLVQIVEATATERETLLETLAEQLMTHFGAPDLVTARAAAGDEIAFVESLCEQPQDTLIAVHRTCEESAVRESFRSLRTRTDRTKSTRAFSFFEIEGDEVPDDTVSLVGLADRECK